MNISPSAKLWEKLEPLEAHERLPARVCQTPGRHGHRLLELISNLANYVCEQKSSWNEFHSFSYKNIAAHAAIQVDPSVAHNLSETEPNWGRTESRPALQAKISRTIRGSWVEVSFSVNPLRSKKSSSWCRPSRCRMVACQSATLTGFSTAR